MRICSCMHVLQVCHADLKLYVYAGLICSCCGFAGFGMQVWCAGLLLRTVRSGNFTAWCIIDLQHIPCVHAYTGGYNGICSRVVFGKPCA